DDVDWLGDLSLAADHQTLCIRTNGHLLVTDRCSAQEDRVADPGWRRRHRGGLSPVRLREGGCRRKRQEQHERPSTMESAHRTRIVSATRASYEAPRMTSPDDYAAIHAGAALGAIATRGQIDVAGPDHTGFL